MTLKAISRRRLAVDTAGLLAAAVASPFTASYSHAVTVESRTKGHDLEAFDTFIEWLASRIDELEVPGAAVGVVVGDQRFTRGVGVASVDTGESFTPTTPFGIASLSKIFTATTLASLAHRGALGLDDPVRQHLPEFRIADPDATASVTVGHLLSHTGGWADVLEPEQGQNSLHWYAAHMADVPQVVPVGTHFSYSNSGFLLAGAVTEQLVGVPFETAIAESVFQPLGMTETEFANAPGAAATRVAGHQVVDGELAVIPPAEIPRAANPSAGVVSTVEDMLTFVRAHAEIGHGQLDLDALASMRQARTPGGSLGPVVVDHIGTGWMLLDIGDETVLMSQGGDSGLISAMVAVPAREFGMVVFANSDSAMMLVNDAVLRGLAKFVDLTLPEPERYTLTGDEAANAEGRYEIPGWLTFEVAPADGSLHVATSAGGHEIPQMSGRYTMVSAARAFMPYLGGRLWLDLVPADTGAIGWLRFAARLAPRVE